MKIGIDGRLYNETGVGRYIQELINNLQEIDTQNDYFLFLKKNEFYNLVLTNPKWTKILADIPWHSLSEQIRMPIKIAQVNLDLIHIPYFSVPMCINIPFIVTIHDLTISHYATGKATTRPKLIYMIKRLGYKFVLFKAINHAKTIITVSRYVKQQLINEFHISSDKVKVTYESGELENSSASDKNESILYKYILYIGNAHPHKNLERLLQAFHLVKKEIQDIKLVLIGKDDFFYRRLKKFAMEQKLDEGVIFKNYVSPSEIQVWYKKSQLFVFPSLSEGFGIPGLEAMNCQCAVAASNIPVFKEIYEHAAMYFDPKSIEDMAEKITKVLLDKKLQASLINNGNNQVKKYSWRKMAQETLFIYENCLSI